MNKTHALAALVLVVAAATASAQEPRQGPWTVKGAYGYSCSGTAFGSPFAAVGQAVCDGRETCAGDGMLSVNGSAVPWSVTGKYTVEPNGLGLVTYDVTIGGSAAGQMRIAFVVRDSGRQILGMPIEPGYVVICDLKQQ